MVPRKFVRRCGLPVILWRIGATVLDFQGHTQSHDIRQDMITCCNGPVEADKRTDGTLAIDLSQRSPIISRGRQPRRRIGARYCRVVCVWCDRRLTVHDRLTLALGCDWDLVRMDSSISSVRRITGLQRSNRGALDGRVTVHDGGN